jgi:hypothetical protein
VLTCMRKMRSAVSLALTIGGLTDDRGWPKPMGARGAVMADTLGRSVSVVPKEH